MRATPHPNDDDTNDDDTAVRSSRARHASLIRHEPGPALTGLALAAAPAIDRVRHAEVGAHDAAARGSLGTRNAAIGMAAHGGDAIPVLDAGRRSARPIVLRGRRRRGCRRRRGRRGPRRLGRRPSAPHHEDERRQVANAQHEAHLTALSSSRQGSPSERGNRKREGWKDWGLRKTQNPSFPSLFL